MQLSTAQQFALAQMGIPVWVQREEVIATREEDLICVEDFSHIDFTKNWVVITSNALSAAESRLLRAMLYSVDIQLGEVAIIEQQLTAALSQFSAANTVVLILGEIVSEPLKLQPHNSLACQQFNTGIPVLVGDSLQQLLAEPERKSAMWQTLLQWRNLKAYQID